MSFSSGGDMPRGGSSRAFLRWLPGLLVTALAVWFLVRTIHWQDFINTLLTIPVGTLLFAMLIYLISMVVRAFGWQTLLQRKVSSVRAVLALNEGYFINNILPLRLGELGRALLLGRHSKLGLFQVLSTIVVERSYDLVIASALLLGVLPMILKMDWARPIAILLLVVIVLGLVLLYFAAKYRVWIEDRVSRLVGGRLLVRKVLVQPVHNLLEGFSVLNRLDLFAISFLFLCLTWLLATFEVWVLLRALAPGAPFWWALLAVSASNLGGALPSAAASLGVFEAAAVAALSLVGLPHESALAYALIVHGIHLIFSSLIGGYALSQEGRSLAEIYADLRTARP